MNDKNTVMYDPYVHSVRDGLMKDFEFKLLGQPVKGAWLLCDGGYRQLQCPRLDSCKNM